MRATFSHKGSRKNSASHLRRAVHHPGDAELVGAHAKALGEERLAERHADGAAFGERLEFALGVGGILHLQRDGKALRRLEVAGRRVRGHQHLAVDGDFRVHDLLLIVRRDLHLRRTFAKGKHRLDLRTEHLLVKFHRRFAIAVVVEVGTDLHWNSPSGMASRCAGHFSVSRFRLARPASKSLPTILSKLKNTPITFDMNVAEPCITQCTLVALPCGSIVNSAVLCASNGLKKSSLMASFDGAFASRISMRPVPTFLSPSQP